MTLNCYYPSPQWLKRRYYAICFLPQYIHYAICEWFENWEMQMTCTYEFCLGLDKTLILFLSVHLHVLLTFTAQLPTKVFHSWGHGTMTCFHLLVCSSVT